MRRHNEGTPLVTIQGQNEEEIIPLKDYFPSLKLISNKWGRLVVVVIVNLVVLTNIALLFTYLLVTFDDFDEKQRAQQGLSFDPKSSNFINLHKLFMVLGLCILPPNAVLIYRYRIFKVWRFFLKVGHAVILLTSFLCGVAGLGIILKYFIEGEVKHFTSIHSWLGLMTLGVFALQWLVGILVFLIPTGMPLRYKEGIMVFHRFAGLMLVVLPTLTVFMGLSEASEFGINEIPLVGKFLALGLLIQATMVMFFLHGPGNLILKSVQEQRNDAKFN